MKRKQLILDEKNLKDLKKIWRGGIYRLCSDSAFVRELIEDVLKREVKK